MLLDFASRCPDLPEWQVIRILHKCACQCSSRFKRLTILKGIKVHPFKHASTLTDFNFGHSPFFAQITQQNTVSEKDGLTIGGFSASLCSDLFRWYGPAVPNSG